MIFLKTINYEDLVFIDKEPFNSGSFGKLKRCIYDGNEYVCKTFNDAKYLNGKRRKLSLLSEIEEKNIYVPKFWVKKSNNVIRYLADSAKGKDIDILETDPIQIKINTLKNAKNLILTMHKNGIIHSDISGSNLLTNNGDVSAIDFDNCSYKGYETNINHANDYCQEFIRTYGIKPELDIFMFNLLTYYIMNEESNYYMVRNNIRLNKYGVFNNSNGIKICESLFLDSKVPNKDFLIDTIDETISI